MQIEYKLKFRDLLLFNISHQILSAPIQIFYGGLVAFLFLILLNSHSAGSSAIISLLAYFAMWLAQILFIGFYHLFGTYRSLLTQYHVEVQDEAYFVETPFTKSYHYWSGIAKIVNCFGFIAVYINAGAAHIIPGRAFSSEDQRSQFLAFLKGKLPLPTSDSESVSLGITSFVDCSETASNASSSGWTNLLSNLINGLRMALFMRPAPNGIRISWSQLVALVLLNVAVPFVFELVRIGLNGTFAPYELPGAFFGVPVMLFAAWAIALLAGQGKRTLALLIVLSSLAISIDTISLLFSSFCGIIFNIALRRWGQIIYFVYYVPTIWLTLAAILASVRFLAIPKSRWLASILAASFLIGLPLSTIYRSRTLWSPPYDKNTHREFRTLTTEDTFYLQPRLLEQKLAALRQGRKGIIDLYFVGMAGYSSQDVFMKEILSVTKLFNEKFDADGRSVMLINNPKTVTEHPIASSTSLNLALKRIAKVMDRDEDIFFLFMTSHSSRNQKFSLDFWPMQFNDLDPKTLKKMLDDSGIKRRVMVISGCYSGGFINTLKDDHSLVITAASADRESFGCSNEADYTYFGKAYFDEALRKTYSFVEAFEMAKPAIAKRERKENYDSSNPQISLGKDIKQALEEFIRQRQSPSSTANQPVVTTKLQHDRYDEFIDLRKLSSQMSHYRKDCLQEMQAASPAKNLAHNPDYYGGLDQKSPHWPRLMAAWNDHAENWCALAHDENVFRNILGNAWRSNFKEKEIESALQFYRTPLGQRLIAAEDAVSRELSSKLSEARRPASEKAARKYEEEQAGTIAKHQQDIAATQRRNR